MEQNRMNFIEIRIQLDENDTYWGDVLLLTKSGKCLGRRYEGMPIEQIGTMVDRLIKNTKEDSPDAI